MRTPVFKDSYKTNEKWRKRGAGVLLGAAVLSAVGCGVKQQPGTPERSGETSVVSVQPTVTEAAPQTEVSEIPSDPLERDIHNIAHLFDEGCKIGAVEDTQSPSAMLGAAMKDRNNVMVTLNLTMNQDALDSLQGRLDSEIVGAKTFQVTTEQDGSPVATGSRSESEFNVEMQSLSQAQDGSLSLRQSLYLPGPNSGDSREPISVRLKTEAWKNGDHMDREVSEPVCEGKIIYRDGIWQLGE